MLSYLIPIFLFLLFLYSPLNIKIEYSRKGQNDDFNIELYTFIKLLGFSIRIPYLQNHIISFMTEIFAEIDLLFMNMRSKREREIEKEVEWSQVQIEKTKKLLGILLNKDLINLLFSNLKINCQELKWKTEFGLNNPAYTAITTGFVWTLKGVFINLLDELLIFKNEVILKVKPDFDKMKFSTYFLGIFSNRIGNIIITVIKILFYKIRIYLSSRDSTGQNKGRFHR